MAKIFLPLVTLLLLTNVFSQQEIDTLSLPFLEDFSSYTGAPDTNKFYNQGGVFINNDYGSSPRSKNVASFDGIDEFGIPYEQIPTGGNSNAVINGTADYLVSKPINLANLTKDDGLIFSFWWQKGSVDIELYPELDEGDTLDLFFLNEDSLWIKVWPLGDSKTNVINTEAGSAFQSDSVYITDSTFLHAGFQFMFESNGVLTGNYDVWNVNGIYLDSARTTQYLYDFAFGPTPNSILKNYSAMPLEQFLVDIESELSDTVQTTFYNLHNADNIVLDDLFTLNDTVSNTLLESDSTNFDPSIPGAIIIDSLGEFDVIYEPTKPTIATAINSIPAPEYLVLENKLSAQILDQISANNQQYTYTVIDNYFAYDDGTAEVGFGITGTGALATKFELKKASILHSIDLHIVRNGPDLDYSTITLKVWKSIKGVDGAETTEELVQTRVSLIFDEYELNKFYNFPLSTQIEVPAGTFYIGWQQENMESRLFLGFDKSTNNIDKVFTFKSDAWGQGFEELHEGSPMIHPYFGPKRTVSVASIEETFEVELYPNPVTNQFSISAPELAIELVQIFSSNGILVNEIADQQEAYKIDLQEGIYIASILTNKGVFKKKFVVVK